MQPFYYSLGVFGVLVFMGEIYPRLIANGLCFNVIGCNVGFFGYDGFVHFISGLCVGLGLLWYKRHTAQDFIIAALGVALLWEASEYTFDAFRMNFLHMNLFVPENIMTQPSRIDSLGDIVLGCLGAALIYALFHRRVIHA